MILRVIIGLIGIALVAVARGRGRRSRREAAAKASTMTVRTGYTGLENPIYRVVIESGGPAGEATFTWSRDGERGAVRYESPVHADTWIALEEGIDVRFDDGGTFAAGDYWTFPARSAADTITMKARRRGAPSARGRAKRRR